MSRPDTNEFARQVLYHLAALSAEVSENKLLICELLARTTNRPIQEFLDQYDERTKRLAAEFYEHALEEANIPVPEDDSPEPPDQGVNPRE